MTLFKKKKSEIRAETEQGFVTAEDSLLKAMLGGGEITKDIALQIPTVNGGIDLIGNIIASTPIKLYKEESGKTVEIKGDARTTLLNDDTGDTLNANEFWKAIVRDYFLGKGGYAYIGKNKGQFTGLYYVDEESISINMGVDPIFKDFDILVNGNTYKPYDFLKILRNTKNGAYGKSLIDESSELIEVAYQSLRFEKNLVKKGGNKKGFLKASKRLSDAVMAALKEAFRNLYSNNSENVVVLNDGIEFAESSNTSVEMQLNENKLTNAEEFAKIFHISTKVMTGDSNEETTANIAKLAAIPIMTTIQCALNKDLLLEKEKGSFYFAFDTKELLKGNIKERYEAYKLALDANFMQIDEVRYKEDMESLGLSWIKLGLDTVLYDPNTKTIYTPNTNQTSKMAENSLKGGGLNNG